MSNYFSEDEKLRIRKFFFEERMPEERYQIIKTKNKIKRFENYSAYDKCLKKIIITGTKHFVFDYNSILNI